MLRKTSIIMLIVLLLMLSAGCDGEKDGSVGDSGAMTGKTADLEAVRIEDIKPFSESGAVLISLSDDAIVSDSAAVSIEGSVVTITSGGSYILTGTLSDGAVTVSCDKSQEVNILLRNAHITSSSDAALTVLCADAVHLYTDAGTENTLASSYDFSLNTDSNVDAAIFSKDDLYLCGDGALTVISANGHGIVSKDDLTVLSGSYNIMAASHGISAKDSIGIADGTFIIDSGKDGIHAENTDDTTLGWVHLENGAYSVTAGGDGISASSVLQIDDGAYTIRAGGGAAYGKQHTDEMFGGGRGGHGQDFSGWSGIAEETDTSSDGTSVADSCKGLKAQTLLSVGGGTFDIDAADDALHANGDVTVTGGSYTLATGDDGFHADSTLTICGGTVNLTQSYEGLEGTSICLTGGHITLLASDDGVNAAGGADGSGMLGFGGGRDIFSSDGVSAVTISGGYLYMNAAGDGLDSNGDLTVTGGEIFVDGPVDGANGAIDCAGKAVISGGTLVAVGSSQMAEAFDADSTQGIAMVMLAETQNAAALSLYDASGTQILTHTPAKSYNCVYVSAPALTVGGTYTLVTGNRETAITMDSVVVGLSGMGGFGGGQGGFGGFGGGKGSRGDRGDMGQIPGGNMGEIPGMETDENGAPTVPQMPEGGFGGMHGGQMPNGMTPPALPQDEQLPGGGFGGMAPPDVPD